MSDRMQSVIDLNEQVLRMLAMLRNLLGEGSALSTSLTSQLGTVRVDPSHLGRGPSSRCGHKFMPNEDVLSRPALASRFQPGLSPAIRRRSRLTEIKPPSDHS